VIWDCIIIGAGPAGLTAALYAARFKRSTLVLHDGRSRALRIPKTHNVPGFPDGVAGLELIERMTAHAEQYGVNLVEAEIAAARADGDGFVLSDGTQEWRARSLILATGLQLRQVDLAPVAHEAAIAAGTLRYCPVCDGYEHAGQRIGVVGSDAQGAGEALFLRGYSDDVTLFPLAYAELTNDEREQLDAAGVEIVSTPLREIVPAGEVIDAVLDDGRKLSFDVIYPALGCHPRNELPRSLGLEIDNVGKASATAPFGTNVPGLYCAGDLVDGLDQISVAMGHGAIAGTKMHNWLREQDGHTLG